MTKCANNECTIQGPKFDEGKLEWDLLPTEPIEEIIRIYMFGIQKGYPRDSWKTGINYNRLYAAIQRHLQAWWNKEDEDIESGLNHLAHAAWSCITLMYYDQNGMHEYDNRPSPVSKENITCPRCNRSNTLYKCSCSGDTKCKYCHVNLSFGGEK